MKQGRSFEWRDQLSKTHLGLVRVLNLLHYPHEIPESVSIETIDGIFETFQQWEKEQATSNQKQALDRWKKRFQISNSNERKMVYRWLKGSFPTTPRLMKTSDGSIIGSIPCMLETISDKMEAIYFTHEDVDVDYMLQNFHHKYQNAIRDSFYAFDLPPLLQEDFFSIC